MAFKFFRKRTGTGTGCVDLPDGLKLIREYNDCIGIGFHRSGWPWVFEHFEAVNSTKGILFDDFIEQNFCYKNKPEIYNEPWVGVFHHPPNIPYFGNQRENLDVVFRSYAFRKSRKNLKLAIALSEHLGSYLRIKLDCPVLVLKHPANTQDIEQWNPGEYVRNPDKSLVQVGYYLRNTQLIRQIPSSEFKKYRLWTNSRWTLEFDKRVELYFKRFKRKTYDDYIDLKFVPPSTYDELLTKNLVVMEVLDASASNGVLDCIVRNTPIIINKHPAVVEYLGPNYPLYFSNPAEIPFLAQDLMKGYEYLTKMNKSWLSGDLFVKKIMETVHETLRDNLR